MAKREKVFCSHEDCGKFIRPESDWRCPYCDTLNGLLTWPGLVNAFHGEKGKGFNDPCKKCGKLAAFGKCPHCEKNILLNKNGDQTKAIEIIDYRKKGDEFRERMFGKITGENGKKGDVKNEDIEEVVSKFKDVFAVLTGTKEPHDVQMERLKRQKEKELLLIEINKIKGETEKKLEENQDSAWEKYAKILKTEEEKQRFLNELRILKASGKIERAQKLEELKRKEKRKLTHKYLEEFDVDSLSELSPEDLKKHNEQLEDIEDLLDKMRMEL